MTVGTMSQRSTTASQRPVARLQIPAHVISFTLLPRGSQKRLVRRSSAHSRLLGSHTQSRHSPSSQ